MCLVMCVHVTGHISADVFASAYGCLVVYLRGCVCVYFACVCITFGHDSPFLACCCLLTSSIQTIFKSLQLLVIKSAVIFSIMLQRLLRSLLRQGVLFIYYGIFFTQK